MAVSREPCDVRLLWCECCARVGGSRSGTLLQPVTGPGSGISRNHGVSTTHASATASLQRSCREGVAVAGRTVAVADREPALALLGGAVGPRLAVHPARRRLLDAV